MTALTPAHLLDTETLDRTLKDKDVPKRIARTLPLNRRWVADVASDRVADALKEWLGEDLSDDVMAGYAKFKDVRQAATDSLTTPDETKLVELGEHTVKSSHPFSVEVSCEEKHLAEVEAEVTLQLTVPIAAVSVQDGAITAVRLGGGWALSVELAVEGQKVTGYDRELKLEREFRVHVQVARKPAAEGTEQPTRFVPVPVDHTELKARPNVSM